jgi:hypothetical protein
MRVAHAPGRMLPAAPRARPGRFWLASLAARCRPWRLDRDLAAGVPTWRTASLAARSRQLTSDRSRRRHARGLERLAEVAELASPSFSAAVPPCREQVRAARPLLLSTAARLRDPAPISAAGVARIRLLLGDGAGPCFVASYPNALVDALGEAVRRLEPVG